MAVELRPHQKQAVKDLSNGKVLWGGVGAGKSITVCAYYMENEAPRDIYVITTARKRDTLDWEKEFVKFGIYKSEDATVAGVLHVDSWNNLGKYTAVHDAFFIFDEQRLVGSGAWTKAFLHIAKSNRWVLLSATPGDTWLDYVPVFLANGFYKNRTEFKREHVVYNTYSKFPKVDHYVGAAKLTRLKNQVLVEMPYTSHTTRHTRYMDVEHDKESFHKALVQRWHVFEQRPIRDVAELFMVMRKIVNSDPSRLETVRCLMEKHPKLIVFYNFNYELEMLRSLASTSQPEQPRSSSTSTPDRSTPSPFPCSTDGSDGPSFQFPDSETSRQNDRLIGTSTSTSLSTLETSSSKSDPMHQLRKRANSNQSERLEKSGLSSDGSETLKPKDLRDGFTYATPNTQEPSSPKRSTVETVTQGAQTFQIAEWNGHKHEPIPTTDRWVYLVQYTAGSEGWNCTETDAMVFYSLTYSYKHWHQAFGRIDRLNTPFKDLYYYVLRSTSVIDRAIENSLKHKKAFNESSMNIKF